MCLLGSAGRLKGWAALGLLAAGLLWLLAWPELLSIGQSMSDGGAHPYAMADQVRLGLRPWLTFYEGDPHVGPYYTYPLLWGWALLNTLLLWPLRPQFAAARAMFTLHSLTAALLIVAGLTWLPYAASEINALFTAGPEPGRSLSGFGPYLVAEQCTGWSEGGGCQSEESIRILNPAFWGLIGLTLAPLLGLLVREPRPRPVPAPTTHAPQL
ncbi:hypothetical protein [Deinococcus radiophilus]|uniref:Uncharacterized protein n=1 Tax=Deinococcus radiophilus TaxID=32062 RepID=A0A3S0IBN7_9DEIO|nr:hypothetical protein [Deinococcus radiophilus]RTR28967.1 hypothetical protein EJ104_03735 [Deinococcus radiophilus]UFA49551.1 hypothetical protein LMT64_06480 [Deinococcus radiophilus]